MLLPKSLKKGDTVGIVVPSGCYRPENEIQIKNFTDYLKTLGLKVKLAKNFYLKDKYKVSAGTPQQRADDINSMFADKHISAIWCLHGGDSVISIIDLLDYQIIKNNPKIFIGKSDIDMLSIAINKVTGLVTFHGPDSKLGGNYPELDGDYTQKWFNKRLFDI